MIAVLKVFDESTNGDKKHQFDLRISSERISVRELITRRVKAEVENYNRKHRHIFRGLIQPEGAEVTEQGFKLDQDRDIDMDQQCEKAITEFHKGLMVKVDDKPVHSLDEILMVAAHAQVNFVKLCPIIGG